MITVTDSAAEHIKKYLEERGYGLGIRLGVKRNGCSGMEYVLEYADVARQEDTLFEDKDVTVIVDPKSISFLDGTEIHYKKIGLNEGFEFINPNVKDVCGCGESFNI